MNNLKILIIITLIFVSTGVIERAKAQTKPIYFNGDKIVADPNYANSYGVFGKLSNQDVWVLKRYDFADNLLMTGTYKDDQLTIPDGEFLFYASVYDYNAQNYEGFAIGKTDRYIRQKGSYENGLEVGKWFDYYPNGAVLGYRAYVQGKLEGETKYFGRDRKLLISGNYKNDLKTGTWYDIKKRLKQVYNNDELVSTVKLTRDQVKELQ